MKAFSRNQFNLRALEEVILNSVLLQIAGADSIFDNIIIKNK